MSGFTKIIVFSYLFGQRNIVSSGNLEKCIVIVQGNAVFSPINISNNTPKFIDNTLLKIIDARY